MREKKNGSPPTKARSQKVETRSDYAKSGVSKKLKPTRESNAELENLYLRLHWICSPHDWAGTKRQVKSILKACRTNREREIELCRMIIDASKQIAREDAQ